MKKNRREVFKQNRCENIQILFSILNSTKLVFNVPALGEVANFGTDYFLSKIKFLARNKRVFTTKFAILPSIYVKAVTLSILKIIVILVTM